METQLAKIRKFESHSSEFEFVRFGDLSQIERAKHKGNVIGDNNLVIIQKSFNPGFNVFPIKDNDFVGFLINKLIEEDESKRELLRNPFSNF